MQRLHEAASHDQLPQIVFHVATRVPVVHHSNPVESRPIALMPLILCHQYYRVRF
jgi:hypothetical protein